MHHSVGNQLRVHLTYLKQFVNIRGEMTQLKGSGFW